MTAAMSTLIPINLYASRQLKRIANHRHKFVIHCINLIHTGVWKKCHRLQIGDICCIIGLSVRILVDQKGVIKGPLHFHGAESIPLAEATPQQGQSLFCSRESDQR